MTRRNNQCPGPFQFLDMSQCILIIEGDPDILDIMGYILSEEGFETILSRECKPIDSICSIRPDLILIDYSLSDELVLGICLGLKKNCITMGIPLILVSTNSKLEQIALESHADGILSKPFDVCELVALSRHWLSR